MSPRLGSAWALSSMTKISDELVRTEDFGAERHAYARATILQKRGVINGSLQEVREAIKETLDEAG